MSLTYNKILIIGNGASGKSTLSKHLSNLLNVPLLHLDSVYWLKDWMHNNPDVFTKTVRDFMKKDKWIIEGTPLYDIENRIKNADTIILMDINRYRCIANLIMRCVLNMLKKLKTKDGCPAKSLNIRSLLWIWHFRLRRRPLLLKSLNNNLNRKKYFEINHYSQLTNMIMSIKNSIQN